MFYKERKCINCGKTYKPRQANAKFCCRKCSGEYNRKHPKSDEEKIKQGFTYRKCKYCGQKFLALHEYVTTCKKCKHKEYSNKTHTKQPAVKLSEFEDEARKKNLSYRQLQGIKRLKGENQG